MRRQPFQTSSEFWGNLVRQLRIQRGYSERRLAFEADVHRASLRRCLDGRGTFRIDELETILAIFGHELDAHVGEFEDAE